MELEGSITKPEIERVLGITTINDLLRVFVQSSHIDFQNSTRKFIIYFLAIESLYEEITKEPLSFKGLDEPTIEENPGY